MPDDILTDSARTRTGPGRGTGRGGPFDRERDSCRPTSMMRGRTIAVALGLALAAALSLGPTSSPPADATPVAVSATAASASGAGLASDCTLLVPSRHRPGAQLPGRPGRVTLALATRYKTSSVRVTHCLRAKNGTYREVWRSAGRIGRNGFAPPGTKREGDGRSPVGAFRLTSAFGGRNPGAQLPYTTLRPDSCWGSTVGSSRYNRYFRGRCGPKDEAMHRYVRGAYAQGLVIAYNTRPVRQGHGSAIFLHATTGRATAGCVSIPLKRVTGLVQTTRPGDVILTGIRGVHLEG